MLSKEDYAVIKSLNELGYDGGRTILRQYIQPKRVLRPNRATVRFETEPGKQLQSDWGEVLVDNQKSTVLQASNIGQPKFNERFVDLGCSTVSPRGHAGRTGHAPRARMNEWSVTSSRTSLSVTAALRVGYIIMIDSSALSGWSNLSTARTKLA